MFGDIQIGLKRPPEKDAPTDIDGMRRAIERARRDSAVIAQCLRQAEFTGLSGEDKYVLLAYHALTMLEDYSQRCLRFMNLSPVPPMVVKDGSVDQPGTEP